MDDTDWIRIFRGIRKLQEIPIIPTRTLQGVLYLFEEIA